MTFGINENIAVRGIFTTLNIEESLQASEIDYEAEYDLGGAGVMFDYHPFAGKFRISTGLLQSKNELVGVARPTTAQQIGDDPGRTFGGTPGDRIDLTLDSGGTVPYFGIGFGSPASEGFPIGFGVDLGVVPMSPEVDLKLTGNTTTVGLSQAAIDAAIQQEEDNIQNDLSEFELWPVLQIKASYRF